MIESPGKCQICQGLLDEEDLFCANCGAETPQGDAEVMSQNLTAHSFECDACGASMSYDARVQNLHCPFCGNEKMEVIKDQKLLAARLLVPMKLEKDRAMEILKKWLGQGIWRPFKLFDRATVVKLQPIYIPFWKFRVTTKTYWTADTSRTPAGARADWFPISGEHVGQYDSMLVSASTILSPDETRQTLPFDLSSAIPRDTFDLGQVSFEQFRVQRKYARPLARLGFEEEERVACSKLVNGKSRNVKVNVRFEGMSSEPVLLPYWILSYRYRKTVYRFLINGQTGKATGTAPISWLKVGLLAAIVLAFIIVMNQHKWL